MSARTPVLIVGAGPTGLVLALWLTKIGVRCRLIDKASEPGTTSRALAMHARTLEFYRQLGIAEAVVEAGFPFPRVNLWVNRRKRASLPIGEIGKGLTPFPYVLIFPQDQHERLLIAELGKLGVEVERQTELLDFSQSENGVVAKLRRPSGAEEVCHADYLAGCDGARSTVREKLGVGFSGSTYPGMFYVADVEGEGPVLDGELHASLEEAEFLAVFPLKQKGHARLIGVVHEKANHEAMRWEDVNPRIFRELDIKIDKVHWFSTYHVHHRVAATFQKGRSFLLGDAGHIHSPVGGQGMNTGIGDAVNLAWRLGEVLQGRAKASILETYNTERIAFAERLVRTVDRAFEFITASGRWARIVRTKFVPVALRALVSLPAIRRLMFRTVSQTNITYRDQSENQGRAVGIQSGDRLPWIESVDNFEPLKSLAWQIHVYGQRNMQALHTSLPLHRFPWSEEMARKGLKEGAAYHIRPDGYVGRVL